MTSVSHNLDALANVIEQERGPLELLALFLPEGKRDWELLIAATWAKDHIRDAIGYVNQKAAEVFSKEEASEIRRIVVVSSAAAVLADMFPGPGEYDNFTLYEVDVKHAIIARLRPPA